MIEAAAERSEGKRRQAGRQEWLKVAAVGEGGCSRSREGREGAKCKVQGGESRCPDQAEWWWSAVERRSQVAKGFGLLAHEETLLTALGQPWRRSHPPGQLAFCVVI